MRKPIAAVAALIILVGIAGCAEEPLGAGRLSESKGPAQLLRVEAVSRVPGYQVSSFGEPDERSRSCDKSDPIGKMRQWRSSIEIFMIDNASVQPKAIVDTIVTSFEDQEWVAEEGDTELITTLTKEMLATSITITRTPMDTGGTITIAVDGPCVETAGQEDPAVKRLDGRP
jgi:hypothetical protein